MSGSNIQPPVSESDIRKYEEGWTREMQVYWRERLLRLKVWNTGNLYRSFEGRMQRAGDTSLIEHRFAAYGIYVALGTGNGYKKGNSGKDDENGLQFMRGGKYNKGKGHRQKRDWFNKKYYASIMRLGEVEAAFYGQAYQGLIAEALNDVFAGHAEKHIVDKRK